MVQFSSSDNYKYPFLCFVFQLQILGTRRGRSWALEIRPASFCFQARLTLSRSSSTPLPGAVRYDLSAEASMWRRLWVSCPGFLKGTCNADAHAMAEEISRTKGQLCDCYQRGFCNGGKEGFDLVESGGGCIVGNRRVYLWEYSEGTRSSDASQSK